MCGGESTYVSTSNETAEQDGTMNPLFQEEGWQSKKRGPSKNGRYDAGRATGEGKKTRGHETTSRCMPPCLPYMPTQRSVVVKSRKKRSSILKTALYSSQFGRKITKPVCARNQAANAMLKEGVAQGGCSSLDPEVRNYRLIRTEPR